MPKPCCVRNQVNLIRIVVRTNMVSPRWAGIFRDKTEEFWGILDALSQKLNVWRAIFKLLFSIKGQLPTTGL